MSSAIFELNGETLRVEAAEPRLSLLSWLRARGLTGTKEGCAEGECGACAVALLSEDAQGRPCYLAINSCLFPLTEAHGQCVWTVEGIGKCPSKATAERKASRNGKLHVVQEAMALQGGSQCGYCTPGFVVSLFCEYYRPGRDKYDPESISGNLCRCTGYRPIIDVAEGLGIPPPDDPWRLRLEQGKASLDTQHEHGLDRARPHSLGELFLLLEEQPLAEVWSGATDAMIEANRSRASAVQPISLSAIEEMQRFEWTDTEITIGAALSLSALEQRSLELGTEANDNTCAAETRILRELLPRFSSRLIRNRATLGGNLATASPIGDGAPALMALDAELTLQSRSSERRLRLHEFFVGYRQTQLATGEVIVSVHLPRPLPQEQRFYKVSKRLLDDISTVSAAFGLDRDADGKVRRFTAAYGGVAATPLRATALEQLAVGKQWNEQTLAELVHRSGTLATPVSDHRGSAAYRRAMMGKLLERFYFDTQNQVARATPAGASP